MLSCFYEKKVLKWDIKLKALKATSQERLDRRRLGWTLSGHDLRFQWF